MAKQQSPGNWFEAEINSLLKVISHGPCSSDRKREVIENVTPGGAFTNGMTLDQFVHQAGEILAKSGQIYSFQHEIVYDRPAGQKGTLVTLSVNGEALPRAAAHLGNFMVLEAVSKESRTQAPLPGNLAQILLADQHLPGRLPTIQHYSNHPTFDSQFNLCHPGWNPDEGILVHGPEISPELFEPPATGSVQDRLPPHLRSLLGDFCWQSQADLANAVAYLLTGMLIPSFLNRPRPIALVTGNKPGVGKSAFIQAVGRILDGFDPASIRLSQDEELEKKLGGHLRDGRSSLIFLDNVRTGIDSPLLEEKSLASTIQFRILGQSNMIERRNTFLWAVTANNPEATPDIVSRSLPIRLTYEHSIRERNFTHPLDEFDTQHRLSLLGELAGMVVRWTQAGCPMGDQQHRCHEWARILGGILDVAGLGQDFLSNLEEAESAINVQAQDLSALAEEALGSGQFVLQPGGDRAGAGALARDWIPLFTRLQLMTEQMKGTPRSQAQKIGSFLGGNIGQKVTVDNGSSAVTVTLCFRNGRASQRFYYFEIATPADPCEEGTSLPLDGCEPNTEDQPVNEEPIPTQTDTLDWLGDG